MRMLASALVGLILVACDPVPPEPPVAPDPEQTPVEVDGRVSDVPRSVQRLVAAEHRALSDMENLVSIVGDSRGRSRIEAELESQRAELDSIERGIERADSESLDDLVRRINRLKTRSDLLHESLIVASQ